MTATTFTIMVSLCGLLAVTLIDTLGSIISRKLNFNYGWFAILSFVVYTGIPFVLSKTVSFEIALAVNVMVGIFEATIGCWISKKLKANVAVASEKNKENVWGRISLMIFTAFILGYLGYVLGK